MDDLLADATDLLDDTIELRRALHAEPEIGLDLPRTTERVLAALEGLDLGISRHERTSGVVAVLEAGDGPAVLLRGDMDGLPVVEESGEPFAARNGAMHACGHDLHTAMLVGAARLLDQRRSELPGPVIFMFQPGEEGWHGARFMLEEGLLEAAGRPPTRALALHAMSNAPTGMLLARPGPMMAAADEVIVTVTGRGGHASMPHAAADPVPVLAETLLAIEVAITRRVPVSDPAVVTFGIMAAGSAHNVIPETARMHGTMRTLSAERRDATKDLVRTVASGVAGAHGVSVDVEFVPGYGVTANDEREVDRLEVLADRIGVPFRTMDDPIMGAEDFSYVLERVPGAMAFLGAAPEGTDPEEAAPNHSNRVRFDESVMARGIATYAAFALD